MWVVEAIDPVRLELNKQASRVPSRLAFLLYARGGLSMKIAVCVLLAALVAAGCATGSQPATPAAGASTFTGEVWTWDEQTNVVTLRQGERTIRVKVSPAELRGLQLHQVKTIRGELAGPAEIATITIPSGTLVPRGAADQLEVGGTVSALDPAGKVGVASDRGPLVLWIAQPGGAPFRSGDRVHVRLRVQPFDTVTGQAAEPARGPEPSASIGSEPGEYAVVKGKITAVDTGGRLTLESPRGPVTVAVPNAARYRMGETVEVHSSVHPAR
jgi:hypothetical protein